MADNREKKNPGQGTSDPNRQQGGTGGQGGMSGQGGSSGGMGGQSGQRTPGQGGQGGMGGQGSQGGQQGGQGGQGGQFGRESDQRQGGLGGQGTQGGRQNVPGEEKIGDPNRQQPGRKASPNRPEGDEEDDATGFDREGGSQKRRSEEDY